MPYSEADRAELDSLRSEWREALLAARAALRAEEGVLKPEELEAHERHLHDEYKPAAEQLRRFALDEGLAPELAEPFLPRGLAQRALGLPPTVRSCVFELDDVLVGSVGLHLEAWAHSRGIRLPEGRRDDPAGAQTVHGLANRKNEWLGQLLEQRGVAAFDGVRHYLELAHDAGLSCAVVSASAHAGEMLERSDLAKLVDGSVDAETIAAEQLRNRPAPDRLLAACRKLRVEPASAAAFEATEAGVAAARAAGFAWVVAVDPAGDPDRLRRLRHAGADVAVSGLADILRRAA